jgi:Spx/MgsR family transcriptional regulator
MNYYEATMTKLFGIPNCDTVKKARKFLESEGIKYDFHDFRKDGVTEGMIQQWLGHIQWEELINKRSTSFRQLSDEQKSLLTEQKSYQLLIDNPTLLKRPIFDYAGTLINGFKPDQYQQLLDN